VADIIVDGKTAVWLVDSISDISAPTLTELNAGTDITAQLTADGLIGFAADTSAVDTTSMANTFNTSKPGRASFSGMALRLKRQSGTDTVYDTYVKDFTTNVVVRRDGSAYDDAWASSDVVEVYPVTCGRVKPLDPEPDSVQRFEIPLFASAEPNLRAVATS